MRRETENDRSERESEHAKEVHCTLHAPPRPFSSHVSAKLYILWDRVEGVKLANREWLERSSLMALSITQ